MRSGQLRVRIQDIDIVFHLWSRLNSSRLINLGKIYWINVFDKAKHFPLCVVSTRSTVVWIIGSREGCRDRREGRGGGGRASPNKKLRVLGLSPEISVQRFCFGTDIDCSKLGQQLHPIHDAVKTALPTVHQATNIRTTCEALNKTPATKSLI